MRETARGWNYADVWEFIAKAIPNSSAIIQNAQQISWRQFDENSSSLAALLEKNGIRPGDKVAQYLQNCPEYLQAVFACFKAGYVPVNTNYRYAEEEIVYLWDNADARAVIFQGQFATLIENVRGRLPWIVSWLWVDDGSGPCPSWAESVTDAESPVPCPVGRRGGDDLVFTYTGGTTGNPKAAMWRQDDLFHALSSTPGRVVPEDFDADFVRSSLRNDLVTLVAAPLMHGFGLNNSVTTLSSGGTIVLNDRGSFDGDCVIDLIERHRVSSLCLVGDAMSLPLLDVLDRSTERREVSSVRLIISAGVFWSAEVKSRLLAHFGKARLLDLLASSEAIGTGSASSSADSVAGSARFTPGPFTKVVTEGGEFVAPGSGLVGRLVTGGRLPVGYYKDDAKSAATFLELDGRRWSASGDLATVEADGIIRLMGRETLVINSGGEKIHPEEVEIALRTHPSVSDAVVVGLPDDRFGQVIVGLVQMNPDQEFDESKIRDHVRQGLAAYKVPRHLIRVESVGRGANGKVDIRSHIDHAQQAIRSA